MHIHNVYMNEKQHYIKHGAVMPSFLHLYSLFLLCCTAACQPTHFHSKFVSLSLSGFPPIFIYLTISLSSQLHPFLSLSSPLMTPSFPLSLYLSIQHLFAEPVSPFPSPRSDISIPFPFLHPVISSFFFCLLLFFLLLNFCFSPPISFSFFFASFCPFCFPSLDLRLLPF